MKAVPLVLSACFAAGAIIWRERVGKAIAAAALLVSAALALYGLQVVELPRPEELVETVGTRFGAWTYLLVGALAYLESAAFVGLVAPGEFAVVFGGLIAGHGEIELVTLVFVVWGAALAGDVTGYVLGRRLGRPWLLRRGSRFGVTPARLEWAERYFASHGGKTILVGRFVGIVRAFTPFIAGSSRMSAMRFIAVDTMGAGLWAATFSILGFVFWQSLDQALELARRGKLGLLAALVLLAVALVAFRLARQADERRRFRAWARQRAVTAARWWRAASR
jgi:membrane protein DedA with SNARE-associated domain